MASILFYCEKFKLKLFLCFGNVFCGILYFVEVLEQPRSLPKSCLSDSTHQKTTGSLEDANSMGTASMLRVHTDEFRWIPLLWFEWLPCPVRCTYPTGDPGECCHLFQCLVLVPLQALKEAPGPCTAVAERQACNLITCCRAWSLPEGPKQPSETKFTFSFLPPVCYKNVIIL